MIYIDPTKEFGKQYGFHVYRSGWIYDPEQSKDGFPSREAADHEARIVASAAYFGHEIIGGLQHAQRA